MPKALLRGDAILEGDGGDETLDVALARNHRPVGAYLLAPKTADPASVGTIDVEAN